MPNSGCAETAENPTPGVQDATLWLGCSSGGQSFQRDSRRIVFWVSHSFILILRAPSQSTDIRRVLLCVMIPFMDIVVHSFLTPTTGRDGKPTRSTENPRNISLIWITTVSARRVQYRTNTRYMGIPKVPLFLASSVLFSPKFSGRELGSLYQVSAGT